jgi:hypothetical protein
MKIIRKILATVLFIISGLALANFAISILQTDSFESFIFSLIFYGGISAFFGLGAIFLWEKKLWRILLRNFLGVVAAFSLLVSITSPLISKWVFNNYQSSELESFNSLGVNALIGAIILVLATFIIHYLLIKTPQKK